jgi:hypothetical protein
MRSGTNRITARIGLAAKVEPTMIVWKEDDWGSSMRRKQTLKLDVADLIARRIQKKQEKALKLAIIRYRHLRGLSAIATDASERARLHTMALTCLAKSAELE